MRTGLGQIPELVRIDDELNVYHLAYVQSARAILEQWRRRRVESLHAGYPPGGTRASSDIVTCDLQNGSKRQITHRGKFFAPAISPDGQRIVAVRYTRERDCDLVIMDAESGKLIREIPNPDNDFLETPCWTDDGRLVYLRQHDNKLRMEILTVETGVAQVLTPYDTEYISSPVSRGKYVYYSSAYSGIDHIYALDMETGARYRVVTRRFGAYHPSVSTDGKKLLFADYRDENGYRIYEIDNDPSAWEKLEDVEIRTLYYFDPLVHQEQGKSVYEDADIPDRTFATEPYSPILHTLNFHSWILGGTDTEISLDLMSDDVLGTTHTQAGVYFNVNENVPGIRASIEYMQLPIVLGIELDSGGRTTVYSDSLDDEKDIEDNWREFSTTFGAHLPLNFSRGAWWSKIDVGSEISYVYAQEKDYFESYEMGNGTLVPVRYYGEIYHILQPSSRDIAPRWGHKLNASFTTTPFSQEAYSDFTGKLFSGRYKVYVPGFMKHHSLKLTAEYEKMYEGNYRFMREMLFPRGYDDHDHEDFYKGTVSYRFPISYNDFYLGRWLYLRSNTGGAFFDYGVAEDEETTTLYRSFGLETEFETVLFSNINLQINLGLRAAYRVEEEDVAFEVFLGGFDF